MALYLVPGGGGFIGSNLVQALLESGERVRVLDNFATGRRENLLAAPGWAAAGGGDFELLEGDIRDARVCREAMPGVDFVLHQAAIPSVARSVEDPWGSHEVNVDGTLRLLEAAREAGVRRFVFASSSSVYGESETLPKSETMAADPISPYGLQKYAAERYCILFHRLYGLPTVSLRYFNVFGPRQNPDSQYAAVIPLFLRAVRRGARPTIFGDGEQTRDFTYVENVVQANLRSCAADLQACGKAYNVGCGEQISLNRLLQRIAEISGTEVRAQHAAPRAGDIRHSLASIDLARRGLDYEPRCGLVEGLERTLAVLQA